MTNPGDHMNQPHTPDKDVTLGDLLAAGFTFSHPDPDLDLTPPGETDV